MNRGAFMSAVRASDVRSDAFDIDGSSNRNECYVLAPVHDAWVVFYAERGVERDRRRFDLEEEALDDLLATLLADPSTRR